MQKSFDKKKFISQNSIWLVLIALVIVMSIAQPNFFTLSNLTTLLTGEAVKGIMAFGVMFAILSKGIDLTIGASAALVACVTASLVQPADYANARFPGLGVMPVPVVILIGLALGAVIGAIYGAIIAYTKIPPFIATLGGQLICRAGAKMFTNRPISNLDEGFRFFGAGKIAGIPVIILVFVIMYIIAAFLLTQTRVGKNVYAIGGGLATLPFLYDISDKTGWFTHTDITNLIAISESTPGPIGVNAATYVGFLTHGLLGALTSTLGLIAPSIIVIILVSRVLERFRDSRLVDDLFYGLRPASTGLIASAGFLVVKSTFFSPAAAGLLSCIRWPQVVLAVVLFAAIKKFNKHPIVYIAASAVVGGVFHFAG